MNIIPPSGYKIVRTGDVQPGDLLWDNVAGWEKASSGEIGSPVNAFNAVARLANL